MKDRIRHAPVAVVRAVPVFLTICIALLAHRFIPGPPLLRLALTLGVALVAIWAMTRVTRRIDRS